MSELWANPEWRAKTTAALRASASARGKTTAANGGGLRGMDKEKLREMARAVQHLGVQAMNSPESRADGSGAGVSASPEEYGIDTSSVELTKTIRVDLKQFRDLLRDYLRMRGQMTELQTRMSEMVLERQAQTGFSLTHDQLVIACRNVGVDLSCGVCAGSFYTWSGLGEHTCIA